MIIYINAAKQQYNGLVLGWPQYRQQAVAGDIACVGAVRLVAPGNEVGEGSLSFIGAMQIQVRNTCSDWQSATYFTTPNTA